MNTIILYIRITLVIARLIFSLEDDNENNLWLSNKSGMDIFGRNDLQSAYLISETALYGPPEGFSLFKAFTKVNDQLMHHNRALKFLVRSLLQDPLNQYRSELFNDYGSLNILNNKINVRTILYSYILENVNYINYCSLKFRSVVYPNISQNDVYRLSRPHTMNRFLGSHMNGTNSLLDIFNIVRDTLGFWYSGSASTGHERWLRYLERAYDLYGLMPMASLDTCPHLIPDNLREQVPRIKWPQSQPIKIVCCPYPVFYETAVGLSGALNRLGVPNKIVSTSLLGDHSLYIRAFEHIGKYYITPNTIQWNLEKNPQIRDRTYPSGFLWDDDIAEVAIKV